MNQEKLVSIITPLYNKEKYIEATIQSVQAQTYVNWELVIIDDCSSDQSAEIVKQYAAKDGRIRLYHNEFNLGAAGSRNRAVELARGEYIAFLDSDDLWCPDKLQKQLELMQKRQCAFCYSACDVIDELGRPKGKVRRVPESINYRRLLKGNVIPCLTVVIERKQFRNIHMKKMGHEDYILWLDLLQQCDMACGIDEVLGSYREYENSLSSNKMKAAKWTWNIYREYLQLGFVKSCWYFMNYIYGAVRKRV